MKLIKIFVLILAIVFSFQRKVEKIKRNMLKKVDQKQSGICGFTAVLEAALDRKMDVNGLSTDDQMQENLPKFIKSSLKYFKNTKKSVFESIFKETQEYITYIMKKDAKDVWFKNPNRMLQRLKLSLTDTKGSDYSGLIGILLSFDNLKEEALYAGHTIDNSKSKQTKTDGFLDEDITVKNLKKYNGCIVGVSRLNVLWPNGTSLYNTENNKNYVTQHWIYISKDSNQLVNWGEKIDLDESDEVDVLKKLNNMRLVKITEVLCLK